MTHLISIPGLCYNKCARCGQWIIRDGEIDRLEELIATALARNRQKEANDLRILVNQEKSKRNEPCLQKTKKAPL